MPCVDLAKGHFAVLVVGLDALEDLHHGLLPLPPAVCSAGRSYPAALLVGWGAAPSLVGRQVAVLRLHAASAGHVTSAAYSCVKGIYVRYDTKHVRAPRKRPNFRELRKDEVRRIPLLRRW